MINKLHIGKVLTGYVETVGVRNEDVTSTYDIPELRFTEDRLKYIDEGALMWTGLTPSMKETIKDNDVVKRFTIRYNKRHDKFMVKIDSYWYCTDIFKLPFGHGTLKGLKV